MRIPALIALFCMLAVPAGAQTPAAPAAPSPLVAPPQPAPPPAPRMDLTSFVKLPDYQAALVNAAREQMRQAPGGCVGATFKPSDQVTVLDRPRFTNGKPAAGVWSQRIDASGCGPVRALNIMTIVHPDGTLQVVGIMPGDTHADPNMQKNALQYAQAIALRAAPPGCKQIAYVDTRFDGFSGLPSPEVTDGREGRPWREIWTLDACGSLFDVHLVFTPNARGTALAGENPVKHPG